MIDDMAGYIANLGKYNEACLVHILTTHKVLVLFFYIVPIENI